jgi:hypothetical protein
MLQNEELSVVLNDTDCVLTLDSVTMSDDLLTPHTATPTITLGTGYADAASGFGDPMWFYGNARLSAITFADDFVLTFLFSDDPGLAGDDDEATFDVVGSSATAEEVPAPDYTIDASLIAVTADANNIVQTATGSAELTAGLVTGDTYVVVEASGLYAYAAIDAAYLGVTAATTFALEIPAADFTLVGTDLTDSQVRTLIIANIDSGVRSYQAFEITFNPVAVESCGNGILDEGEFCDGSSNLGGWDCSEWNGPGWTGELNCSEDCQIILDDNCSFAG